MKKLICLILAAMLLLTACSKEESIRATTEIRFKSLFGRCSNRSASMATGLKIHMFFCAPFDALGTTMATFAGQNTGARKIKRIKSGLYISSFMGLIYSIFAFLILLIFGNKFALLFLEANQVEIIKNVHQFFFFFSS